MTRFHKTAIVASVDRRQWWCCTVLMSALIVAACGLWGASALATEPEAASTEVPDYMNAPPERIEAWRKLKFGMFIHWGPVSLKGTEIGWSRGGERRGHRTQRNPNGIPVEVYDNLYKEFNPVNFDADEWAAIAKRAGMRYMVFTTKHHDGFCMFDTQQTDYKITSPESPFGRDVVKELADACHRAGLWWGCYYSPPDWHHPDYRTERHDKYIAYLHAQIRELLTNYGQVDILWFDGLGGKPEDWDSPRLFRMIRELQPQILINNRAGLPADFDTPEQRIGRMQTDRPWETCMTICTQWAWKPNDRMKSLEECIHTLVRVVGGDGNLLFNVGPMPDGRIEPRQVERLEQIGDWLARNGESIYDTRGGPFPRTDVVASTYRGNTVYLHVLSPDAFPVTLPAIDTKIVSQRLLSGGDVSVRQSADGIVVDVPEQNRDAIDTIIVLQLESPAGEVHINRYSGEPVTLGRPATASNVYRGMTAQYGPRFAVDDDPTTRWATDAGTSECTLEITLDGPATVDAVIVHEYEPRIRRYALETFRDGNWIAFHEGTRFPPGEPVRFPPVEVGPRVRLHVFEASDGPTLYDFQLLRTKN
ncbi:hypothetical protein JCM19992_04890 [Thermostilla marina]